MFTKKGKKQYVCKGLPYKKKPRLCRICGETDNSKFEYGCATMCYKCRKEKSKNNSINRYKKMSTTEKTLYKERQVEWQNSNFIHNKLLQSRSRAIKHNWDFNLTDEILEDMFIKQNGRCYISNIPLLLQSNNWNSLSIDRIDSTEGYIINNVILVIQFINTAKNIYTMNEFVHYLKNVVKSDFINNFPSPTGKL